MFGSMDDLTERRAKPPICRADSHNASEARLPDTAGLRVRFYRAAKLVLAQASTPPGGGAHPQGALGSPRGGSPSART